MASVGQVAAAVMASATSSANQRQFKIGDLPESEVIRLTQQGHAAAFERIYRSHSARVYALCLRMIGNATEAEDLTQKAFVRVFRKIHTFHGESALSTWIYRVAFNVVLGQLLKRKHAEVSLEETSFHEELADKSPKERADRTFDSSVQLIELALNGRSGSFR
jgi:RNA polymerase sigma-70 factor, ECF subfamily